MFLLCGVLRLSEGAGVNLFVWLRITITLLPNDSRHLQTNNGLRRFMQQALCHRGINRPNIHIRLASSDLLFLRKQNKYL